MIGRKEGGGGVGKNENSIINTFFFCLLQLVRVVSYWKHHKKKKWSSNEQASNETWTYLFANPDRCIYMYIYIFVKRCPLSFRLNTGISSQCRPIRGWVTDLFCVKTRGVGWGDFVTLNRVSCQKAVQSQINAVTHNHNTTSRDRGKWLTSH